MSAKSKNDEKGPKDRQKDGESAKVRSMLSQSRFKKTVFENGLTVLSERHREYRSLSMGIWVKMGTRHELIEEAGVSHFLEHMLFKGTKSRTSLQIAREVDQVGGEFNAFTAREHTCFHLLLLDRDLGLGLDILSDIVLNSRFAREEIERERKVILQEIAMVEESPEELAFDLYFESVFGKHGLGRPILGSSSNIRNMKRDDLLHFFRTYYRPENLVLAVAGDVSHESVIRKIQALRQLHWPGRHQRSLGRSLKFEYLEPPRLMSGTHWVVRPTEQIHLIWGVPGPHFAAQDRFAAFLLNVYLGGGMSSSLFQEIREKNGLAYTVYSSLSPFLDTGVFSIYAATGMGEVLLCLKLIEECVRKVKAKSLSQKELRMIQDNLKGSILLASDCVESRMSSIAKNEIFLGKYVSVSEVCRQIDAVNVDDIKRVAHSIFKDECRSILALGPAPSPKVLARLKPIVLKRSYS